MRLLVVIRLVSSHLFGFVGHPEVYIIILQHSVFVIGPLFRAFARKPLFGYASNGLRHCCIAGLSFWFGGHTHVHNRCMPTSLAFFML